MNTNIYSTEQEKEDFTNKITEVNAVRPITDLRTFSGVLRDFMQVYAVHGEKTFEILKQLKND